jgi:hypothetical protein
MLGHTPSSHHSSPGRPQPRPENDGRLCPPTHCGARRHQSHRHALHASPHHLDHCSCALPPIPHPPCPAKTPGASAARTLQQQMVPDLKLPPLSEFLPPMDQVNLPPLEDFMGKASPEGGRQRERGRGGEGEGEASQGRGRAHAAWERQSGAARDCSAAAIISGPERAQDH